MTKTSQLDFCRMRNFVRFALSPFAMRVVVLPFFIFALAAARPFPSIAGASFPPLEAWRLAVLSGDPIKLKVLYSTSPEPRISDLKNAPRTFQEELSFWTGWKTKGLTDVNLEVLQQQDAKPDLHVVSLRVALTLKEGAAVKHEYILVGQGG